MKSHRKFIVFLLLIGLASISSAVPPMRDLEPLEQFEISSLKFEYVGDFNKPCGPVAYIRDPNGYMHQVRLDNFVGKHMGRAVKITEDELQIEEWKTDEKGSFAQRIVILHPAIGSKKASATQSNKSFKANKKPLRGSLQP